MMENGRMKLCVARFAMYVAHFPESFLLEQTVSVPGTSIIELELLLSMTSPLGPFSHEYENFT